jgi:hypothetical protein
MRRLGAGVFADALDSSLAYAEMPERPSLWLGQAHVGLPPERLTQQPPADGNPFRIEAPLPPGGSRNGTRRFPSLRMARIVPSNRRLHFDGPYFPVIGDGPHSRKTPLAGPNYPSQPHRRVLMHDAPSAGPGVRPGYNTRPGGVVRASASTRPETGLAAAREAISAPAAQRSSQGSNMHGRAIWPLYRGTFREREGSPRLNRSRGKLPFFTPCDTPVSQARVSWYP